MRAPRLHDPIGNERGLLALLIAMSAIGPLALNILTPAAPALAVSLGTDAATVQLTLSLYLLGIAASQLAVGPLSDRFGRRPVVLTGLAITMLSSLAAIAATSIEQLVLARTAQALGASTGLTVGRAIIRDLYERDRAAAMIGWVTMAMVVAPMVAPLIGGLLDTRLGWRAIFAFLALTSAIVLAGAVRALPETRAEKSDSSGFLGETRALATSPAFAGYALCGALSSAMFFTFLGGAPHVVVTMMGHSSAAYGLWFIVLSVGYMAGNFSAARFTQRFGLDRMLWVGLIIGAAGAAVEVAIVVLVPQGGPVIIFAPQTLISFGTGMLLPNAIAGAVSVRPQAAGTASGLAGCLQMALGAAAAQLVGHLLAGAATALPMALMMLGFGLASTLSFMALVRR